MCLATTDTRGSVIALGREPETAEDGITGCEGGQALQEERERQQDLCVIRPAIIIHRVWM